MTTDDTPDTPVLAILGAIALLLVGVVVVLTPVPTLPHHPEPTTDLDRCVEACAPEGLAIYERNVACYCQIHIPE